MNKKVEIEYKDFMHQKTYGNKEENQDSVPVEISSDVDEKLGYTYVPYNDFESPYITNKKEITITNTDDKKMHITPEKKMISGTNLSNDIYLTQLNHQRHDSNGKTPCDFSNQESDDENFDDEIQVSRYERKITDNS